MPDRQHSVATTRCQCEAVRIFRIGQINENDKTGSNAATAAASAAAGDDPFLLNAIWTAVSGGGGGVRTAGIGLPAEVISIIASFLREFQFVVREEKCSPNSKTSWQMIGDTLL